MIPLIKQKYELKKNYNYCLVCSSWWLVFCTIPIAVQICVIPVYSYWISYARVKTIYGIHDTKDCQTTAFNYSQIKTSSIIFAFVFSLTVVISTTSNPNRVLNLGSFELVAVALLSIMFLLFNSTLRRVHTTRTVNSIEFVNFIIFCAAAAFLLVISGNMLSAFFALELLGSITLYSFFIFSGYNISNSVQQSISATTSCVYQFILNFFSSLLFYTALGVVVYYHNTSTIFSATSRLANGLPLAAQTLVVSALLMKLGTGPWIFYKLSVYKGITVQTAVAYTFIYFGAVLVFTFSILTNSGFTVNTYFTYVFIIFFIGCTIIFSSNIFQVGSITLFLSFSSLLNLIFLSLQVI